MDIINTSNWTDNSSFVRNDSIDSFNSTGLAQAGTLTLETIGFLSIGAIGVPGNVLVIAVYLQQMTTSTQVYMFLLAVADTTVCAGVILLSTGLADAMTARVTLLILDNATYFSAFLLSCVAIERLLAVTRPHTFDMNAQRAKKVLLFLTLPALVSAVLTILFINHRKGLGNVIHGSIVIGGNVLIMTVCYVVVTVKLLGRRRPSKYQREVSRRDRTTRSSVKTVSTNVSGTSSEEKDTSNELSGTRDTSFDLESSSGSQAHHATSKKTSRDDTNMYKNVTLLFVITVVFVVSWTPQWLTNFDIPVPTWVRHMFVLNSVVNPFILRRRQRHVPGRRAGVLPTDTHEDVVLVRLCCCYMFVYFPVSNDDL